MPTPAFADAWGPWIPAQNAQLRWEGRARFDKDGAATYDWSNVRVHLRFKGDALAVYAHLGQNYLDALVDGQRMGVLGRLPKVTDHAWSGFGVTATPAAEGDEHGAAFIVSGLGDWEHDVVLSKRTAPNFGPMTLLGLRLPVGSTLLAPPPACTRRLEFVGDSLTNGYGDEGTSKACAELPPYENSSLSWARLTAEGLKAELQSLAFSGYGLIRNYGATEARSKDPVPFYYPRTVLAEPAVWDRRLFVPDLCVVFLGTNDHSTQPTPSDEDFIGAYHAFLRVLRQGRPEGLPLLLAYPDDGSSFAQQVQAVVSQEQAQGHKVEALPLPPAGPGELGCDWHPLAVVHARWADLTQVKIRKMLNW